MVKQVMHGPRFVIAVPDLQRSADYYADVLGFRIFEVGDPAWLFFVRDACYIRAGECPDALPASQLGDHSYFAYVEMDDVEEYYLELTEKGADFTKPLTDEPGGMKEFGVRTVDGHRIMFAGPME